MKNICKICKINIEKGEWIHIRKPNEYYSHIQIKYWFCVDCINSINNAITSDSSSDFV